jgi:hypothetical protein
MVAHVYSIDIPSRQVQVSWLPVGCRKFMQNDTEYEFWNVPNCGRLGVSTNFYLDGKLCCASDTRTLSTLHRDPNVNSAYDPDREPKDTNGTLML